jgi:Tfp pilus assembly protein PilN
MLRTNLSTRPFYNERAVHVAIGLVALVVVGLTIANLVSVVRLSRQNTVLGATMREDRSTAEELTRTARQTLQEINQDELQVIVAAAREANALIDGRTFSWTALFNQLESTLPPDVMLSSVRPTIDDHGTKITMVVLGRRTADLDEFMEKLEATGAFENVLPHQQNLNDDGLTQATIDGMYVPDVPEPAPPPPSPPAPAAPAKPAPPAKKIASAAGGAR